jgi:hypothetical protein
MSARGWIGLLLAAVAFAGCSSSLGSGNPDLPKEGVTAAVACADPLDPRPVAACPGLARVAGVTALEAVETLDPVASGALGAATRWTGWVRGSGIAADGTAGSSPTSGFTTAWCDGESELLFDTTAGDCAARMACDCVMSGSCRGPCGDAVVVPTVDSDAALAAAFPGGAGDDAFDVVFDASVGNWWSVRRSGTDEWIRVDAADGSVL